MHLVSVLNLSLLCCLYFNHHSVMFTQDTGQMLAVQVHSNTALSLCPWHLQSCSRLKQHPCYPKGSQTPEPSPTPHDALWWQGGHCGLSLPRRSSPCCPGVCRWVCAYHHSGCPLFPWRTVTHLSLACAVSWCWPSLICGRVAALGKQPLQVPMQRAWLQVRPPSVSLHLISLLETAH